MLRSLIRILFLCTGNSCRSQMAEGWARHLKAGTIEAYSAGIEIHGLNPFAVKVMAEAGVDISTQRSKHVNELNDAEFDYVITLCGDANERCPIVPGKTEVVHVGFADPPELAKTATTEDEILDIYRRVRDEIRAFVMTLPQGLNCCQKGHLMDTDSETIRAKVREGYGRIARQDAAPQSSFCCGPERSCCGGGSAQAVATAVGYDEAELATLPEGANMGLSCGNPTAIAELRPGETVLDLGSGGGFDVFIAGRKVGPDGKAIGVDMTPEMLAKARKNAATYRERTGWDNVEFRLGEIEHLPVADNSVDVIISNCVINLSPDKPQVWREMTRVLKPGGRVAVSDLALLRPLPRSVLDMVEALIGCIAGAVLVEETERMANEAGLVDVLLTKKNDYVESLPEWQDPLFQKVLEHLPQGAKASDFVTSLYVTARKA